MATKQFKIGLSNADKTAMATSVREQLEAMLFEEYNAANTYNIGDFVVHSDALYRCKASNVTGTWDSSKWESATLGDLADEVNESVKKNVITDLEENNVYSYQLLVDSNGELILRLTEI